MSEGSEQNTRLLDFFRAIWPAQGWYCIAVKTPRGMHQQFYATMEEAASFALAADARGADVYHACAAFKEPGSRKGENVRAVKAFWMDIDVGENKPYADPRLAYNAVEQFVGAAGLPAPGYIFSGGGWHVYWCLEREILADEWRATAAALKFRADSLGLAADPARTGDIASILRPVGTHNRKSAEPRLVRGTGAAFSFYDIRAFAGLGITSEIPNAEINKKFQVNATGQGEPSYGAIIANACGQMRNFRDRRGQLPEPEWYAGLCVLAHCTDGDNLAHEWSAGDARYNFADTQRKLEHGRKDSGPTTCDHFSRLNSVGCLGCPHAGKITSPIVLGRSVGSVQPVAAVTLPALKFPFAWSNSGALTVRVDDEDDPAKFTYETIYKAPVFVSHARKHELTGAFSLALQHWLPHEGWQEALIPWDDHAPKVVLNRLGAQSINVHGPQRHQMVRYLHDAIDDYQSNRKIDMEYAQFGWKGDFEAFLLGDELFTPGSAPRKVGVSAELSQRATGMKAYGSFEHWRAAANGLFAFERQGLMVVAGFASVLMAFAQDAGGLILAAVSEEGGKGKTLGLRGAQTAWGTDSVTAITKTDTANSRFKLISLLGGLPVTWDEMRDRDPEIVKDFVLTFSGGRDKNRLDKNAQMRQNGRNWSTMLIATSNISVAELVSHDGETAQQARILETVFEDLTGVKASDGKEIERQLLANRGHAGRRFIQALMLPGMIDWLRQAIPHFAKGFEQQLGEHNTVLRFYTNGLACLKAAGVILNKAEILEFSTDRIIDYAVKVASGMTGKLADPRNDHVEMMTQCINQNWDSALVVADAWKAKQTTLPQMTPKKALVIRYEREPGRLFIDRAFIKEWCAKKRIMFHNLGKQLQLAGVLVALDKKVSLGAGTVYAGSGQVTAWEVRVAAMPGIELPDKGAGDNVVAMGRR